MYNPDFWEVQLDQSDLEMMPDDVGLWYESPEDQNLRYKHEDRIGRLIPQIDTLLNRSLTQNNLKLLYCISNTAKPSEKSQKLWVFRAGWSASTCSALRETEIRGRCCEKTSQTLPQTRHCHHKLKKRLSVIAQAFSIR